MNDYLPLIKNGFGYYKIIDNNTVFHSISFNNSKLKLILSIPKGKDNTGFETADDKRKQTILTDILTGNNHKGYQIITGLEAYEQSLIIEKKFFEGLFKKQLKNIGKGLSESPPDESFQLLVKWFDSNFNKAYEEYRNNLHDKKEDSKHHFRLYFIERMIEKRKKDFEKGDYSNEEKITNQKFINHLFNERNKENVIIEIPLLSNRFRDFEDAKKWFLKNYDLENNETDRINYLKTEIERTEKSLSSFMSLTQYDLLEGENREYYEGGKKYRDFLHSILEETQTPTNTNTMNGLGLTEKLLIISFLQSAGKFPQYDSKGLFTQTSLYELIGELLTENPDTIKRYYGKGKPLNEIVSGKATPLNRKVRVEIVERVQQVLSKLHDSNIDKEVDNLLAKLKG